MATTMSSIGTGSMTSQQNQGNQEQSQGKPAEDEEFPAVDKYGHVFNDALGVALGIDPETRRKKKEHEDRLKEASGGKESKPESHKQEGVLTPESTSGSTPTTLETK